MLHCENCGAKVENDKAQFCANCGHKLPTQADTATPPSASFTRPHTPTAAPSEPDRRPGFSGRPISQKMPSQQTDELFAGMGTAADAAPKGTPPSNLGVGDGFDSPFFSGNQQPASPSPPAPERREAPAPRTPRQESGGTRWQPRHQPASPRPTRATTPPAKSSFQFSDDEKPLTPPLERPAAPSKNIGKPAEPVAPGRKSASDFSEFEIFGKRYLDDVEAPEPKDGGLFDDAAAEKPAAPSEPAAQQPAPREIFSGRELYSGKELFPEAESTEPPAERQLYKADDTGPQSIQQEIYSEPQTPVYQAPPQPTNGYSRDNAPTQQMNIQPSAKQESSNAPTIQYRAPDQAAYEAPARRTKTKKSGGKKAGIIILLVALFAVLALAVITGVLYFINRPGKAIDNFNAALEQSDYATLEKMTHGVDASGDDWKPLCDAFADEADRESLKKDLTAKLKGEAEASAYPALDINSEPLFLFVKRHEIEITVVDLLLPDAQQGTHLRLNGMEYTGELQDDGGLLLENFMPGRYTAQIIEPNNVVGEEFTVTAFNTPEPNTLTVDDVYDLSIDNCLSDDGVISINGAEVEQKPAGGVVQLPQVKLGSEIAIVIVEGGEKLGASVTFNDPEQTSLSFGNYSPTGEASGDTLSAQEIDVIIGEYYESFLECVNKQDASLIKLSSSGNTKRLPAAIGTEGNKSNLFSFRDAQCDPNTIKSGDTITFKATFEFLYWPRTGSENDSEIGTSTRTVELINEDGDWLVNRLS